VLDLAVQRVAQPLLEIAAGAWALTRDRSLQAVRVALRQREGDLAPIEPADIERVLMVARANVAAALFQ